MKDMIECMNKYNSKNLWILAVRRKVKEGRGSLVIVIREKLREIGVKLKVGEKNGRWYRGSEQTRKETTGRLS